MNTQTDSPFKTYVAATALEANRRVKLTAANTVGYAGAAETPLPLGVTINKAVSAGDPVNVKMWGQSGTHLIESAGAVVAAAAVYGAADGKIDDAVSGTTHGFANEAASGAAKMIEINPA